MSDHPMDDGILSVAGTERVAARAWCGFLLVHPLLERRGVAALDELPPPVQHEVRVAVRRAVDELERRGALALDELPAAVQDEVRGPIVRALDALP